MLHINSARLKEIIQASIKQDRALMIWGQPGIAKSEIVRQVANENGAQLLCIHLSQYDSVDLRGIPGREPTEAGGKMTTWAPPSVLPFIGNPRFTTKQPIYIFLDELPQAMAAVQAPAMQLVLERRLGEHELMPNVYLLAAGNRDSDKSGSNRMLAALCNRFRHVELLPSAETWCDWAIGAGIDHRLIAFMRMRPDLISTFLSKEGNVTQHKAFATPRSWTAVSRTISDASMSSELHYLCNIADVGEGPAAELQSFLKVYASLPDIDALLADPMNAKVPNDPAVLYAISAALASKATEKNFGAVVKYINRIPAEYGVRTVKDIIHRTPRVTMTKEFNKFALDRSDLFRA